MRYKRTLLVSCEIPWDQNEELLEDAFRAEVRHTLANGLRDLYIFGTAGEGYAVTDGQFRRIVEIFAEETLRPDVRPQVGVIALSTAQFKERIGIAHRAGFRAFQISLPSWGVLNDSEMLRFFQDVCGAFPDSRFLHYNLMRTKRLLGARDYRRVADAVPNLCATKNTGTTVHSTMELLRETPEIQHFLGEAMFPTGCLHGECSLLSSFAPMLPRASRKLFDLCVARAPEAFAYQAEYLRVVEDVIAPLRRKSLIDGAYDKVLARLGGAEMPIRLLSPYESFTEEEYLECHDTLHGKYADWLG